MSIPTGTPAIYQPQLIPATASYVVQPGDARRFARAVSLASFKQAVGILGAITAFFVILTAATNGLGRAVGFIIWFAVVMAVLMPILILITIRRIQRVYEVMFRPGERSCSRFGPEALDLENEMSCSTFRYSDLKVGKVNQHVVTLIWAVSGPIPVPRALVPDDVLTWLRGKRTGSFRR